MYIWIGCKLPESFSSLLRAHCCRAEHFQQLDTSGFTLPQHISLKISFETDRPDEIVQCISRLLSRQQPFRVRPLSVSREGSILWIPFEPDAPLKELHALLDQKLLQNFEIPQHPFDKNFLFHSTVFMGAPELLEQTKPFFDQFPLPEYLPIDTFLVGVSETGESGSYRVIREIKV